MSCTSYQCASIEEQALTACGELVPGGQDQIVIFPCGQEPADPEDGTAIAAQIAAGTAFLFSNVMIDIPNPSPQEGQAYVGGQDPRVITYARTLNWVDANVNIDSDAAYESINAATGSLIGAAIVNLVNGDGLSAYINPSKGLLMSGGKIFPPDDSAAVHYAYVGKWKSKSDVQMIATPAGVFN